jgi:hypothetical protein
MPALDFKEIPLASGGPDRDQFELFARDFLELMGFKVLVGPDRGADAGRDLVLEEIRTGIAGETRVKWLVSCKHKAHSGASVKPEDESDIHDRVRTHDCKGFMAIYSTVPSSGLATKLNAANLPFEIQVFDSERMEGILLGSTKGATLAHRYLPSSYSRWKHEHPQPAKIFRDDPELNCEYCGKSLLKPEPKGIVVLWRTIGGRDRTEHMYWCCKGLCDQVLRQRFGARDLVDGWEDVPDLVMPIAYIRWVVATLNEYHAGKMQSDVAFEKCKQLILNLFPLVSRHMTTEERQRIQELGVVPEYMGGWGYES